MMSIALALLLGSGAGVAATLSPETVAAFNRYVALTEARIDGEVSGADRFLLIDGWPAGRRRAADARLRAGELVIESQRTLADGREIDVPGGLIHHWVGLAFIPGATVDEAVALLQDYDRHDEIYRPAVAASRLLARDGNTFRVFLRFVQKKIITVVVNSEHEARFTRAAADRAYSRVVSTRIAEVDNAGTANEREKPVGQDGGYLWRLNTYWRFAERDGGTYVQCEAISLTRDIPFALRWLIGPFVTSIPRESLEHTLQTTRNVLATSRGAQ